METVDSEIGDPSKESLKQILWKSCSSTCSNTDDNLHIPQVKQECKPRLGQEFASLDDVYNFYNKYAKEAGFSVRINSSRKNRENNEIVRKEYVCFKEGISVKAKGVVSETKRRRGITREGCNAKLAVVKSKAGTYTVSIFVEGHSHALAAPQRVHLLRSHRKESEGKKSVSRQLSAPNVSKHQEISMLEMQVGGIQTDGCTEKDICNCERDLHKELSGHDANMLCEHFLSEQEKNSGFSFAINRDDENRLTHCFWVDAVSRRAYQYFGDVVVFDTICNTNRYDMIFASMMGVNNHGQTTIFACSFLSDKSVDSFVWLFEQFKKCMPNCSPKMIITDQDPTVTKAISQTLPDTLHIYCSWHILNKLSEQLNEVTYRDYYSDFQKCIWESCTREEFDSKWKEVIEKCNLNDNMWLHSMYGIRSKWVPACVDHVFSAGMLGSQQSEVFHAFFNSCVSKKNSLVDFIVLFNRALVRQRCEELTTDLVDINEKPCLKLPVEIEKQMAEIYTRKIFCKFQDELWNSLLYKIDFVRGSVNHCVYTAEKKSEGVCESREIVYQKDLDLASCSCKNFEIEGIPCRHILSYLNRMQITCLPNQYIMKRWTKAAKSAGNVDDDGLEMNDYSDKSFFVRRTRLFQLASTVIDKVAFSDEVSKILEEALDYVLHKIKSVVGYGGISERNSTT
ncbi:hypothetical protein ACOSP7_013290 [Xanthoceras sorbifolium]